jgi:hypothetical protein
MGSDWEPHRDPNARWDPSASFGMGSHPQAPTNALLVGQVREQDRLACSATLFAGINCNLFSNYSQMIFSAYAACLTPISAIAPTGFRARREVLASPRATTSRKRVMRRVMATRDTPRQSAMSRWLKPWSTYM